MNDEIWSRFTQGFFLLTGFELTSRFVVPIYQVATRAGCLRYFVQVGLGNSTVDAMLDTGSVGLRVLAKALFATDFSCNGKTTHYGFASGAQLNGDLSHAFVSIGELAAGTRQVQFQLVRSLSRSVWARNYDESYLNSRDFRFGGRVSEGGGFAGIFGINIAPMRDVTNPLIALGVKRWIVRLPQPDDHLPGELILNPDAGEMQGFTLFNLRSSRVGAAVTGCLVNLDTGERCCGKVRLDSGAPGIVVAPGKADKTFRQWPDATKAALVLRSSNTHHIHIPFVVGGGKSFRLRVDTNPNVSRTRISSCVPLLSLSMYCDPRRGVFGLRPR